MVYRFTTYLWAAELLEFPELYEEAIGNLAFIRNLFKLMEASGVTDFNLRDMFKPEYSRTRRNISAVINFAKFREEKVAAYEEAMTKQAQDNERLKVGDGKDEAH